MQRRAIGGLTSPFPNPRDSASLRGLEGFALQNGWPSVVEKYL